MKTLSSPLFQPYASADHPFLYFLFFFFSALGLVHVASDLSVEFFNSIFTDGPDMTVIVFIISLLLSITRHYEQKKEKNATHQNER